jgi:hypothetical protein
MINIWKYRLRIGFVQLNRGLNFSAKIVQMQSKDKILAAGWRRRENCADNV